MFSSNIFSTNDVHILGILLLLLLNGVIKNLPQTPVGLAWAWMFTILGTAPQESGPYINDQAHGVKRMAQVHFASLTGGKGSVRQAHGSKGLYLVSSLIHRCVLGVTCNKPISVISHSL